MSRFLDVTYSEKGAVLGLIDRTFIVAILILSFEPKGPGFKLTFPASRSKIVKIVTFVYKPTWYYAKKETRVDI